MKQEIQVYSNKWGSKILSLCKTDNDYIIVLTKKVFNAQTEITDYQDSVYGHISNLDFALEQFERIRKGFKLRINLSKIK